MITDKIKNIDKYAEIPQDIREFIKNLSCGIECGKYEINKTDYAAINVYNTKEHKNCSFEAHEKYIDVQLLLYGSERLDYIDREGLNISIPYNEGKDIMFYKTVEKNVSTVYLEEGNFALLYPNEAHQPQMMANDESKEVKKVVVKIYAKD